MVKQQAVLMELMNDMMLFTTNTVTQSHHERMNEMNDAIPYLTQPSYDGIEVRAEVPGSSFDWSGDQSFQRH